MMKVLLRLNECIEKSTFFPDGVRISNPQSKYLESQRIEKWQQEINAHKDLQEQDIDLDSDPTDTFFDEHIIREKLVKNKDKEANVEERMRNYKNFAACLSLTERRSKASEKFTMITNQSSSFISPFSNNVFDFNQLNSVADDRNSRASPRVHSDRGTTMYK